MTGTTQHHIHLVTLATSQVIPTQQSIGFEMTDDRLDGLSPLQRSFQPLCSDTAFLAGDLDRRCFLTVAPVTAIHKDFLDDTAR